MNEFTFNDADLKQMEAHGLSPETVDGQLEMFFRGVSTPELIAPCTIGHGITALEPGDAEQRLTAFNQAVEEGRLTKFVPASGAATRMFKELIAVSQGADGKNPAADKSVAALISNMPRFACHDALVTAMKQDGLNGDELAAAGKPAALIEYLLNEKGLGYAVLPKGLILFHRYPDRSTAASYSRTAFEEHLTEAAELFVDRNNRCRIHFTVPPTHKSAIREHIRAACIRMAEQSGIRFEITYSTQSPATDTIAVTGDNTPFRDRGGGLVFRPGGHGALLENLSNLQGDIVFIKNIDNIAIAPVRLATAPAIAAMVGLLVELQQRIFGFLERLTSDAADVRLVEEALAWSKQHLNIVDDDIISQSGPGETGKILIDRLNRPLRVCGVVKNIGEPGGGPFWIRDSRGNISVQIVESAQVNMASSGQKKIWLSSTHFNPVIIAGGVRDFRGRPFQLSAFSDPLAGIITEKSKDGQNLKALEHPGLWNGAMAFWNTVFVELPAEAFNPVKTLFDLLRKGHCPEAAVLANPAAVKS